MSTHFDQPPRHVNRVKAFLLNAWGPADGTGNPLKGTDHDPVFRQEREAGRRHRRVKAGERRWLKRLGVPPAEEAPPPAYTVGGE